MKIDYKTPNQSGFSAIVLVMILMIIGLTLLTAFNSLVTSWQKTILIEKDYYQQFNTARSSLHWAKTQKWEVPTTNWQCKEEVNLHLKTCIKKSKLKIGNFTLVRGEADKLYLYELASFNNNKLIIDKGNWLDYCPEKKHSDCE